MASKINAEMVGSDANFDGASIDSRTISNGQLFIALEGREDGFSYIKDALKNGGTCYLANRKLEGDSTGLVVSDPKRSLMELGKLGRQKLFCPVIGITGSVGKTTVKDLCFAVLSVSFKASASERSFNNKIGVPLTVLNAPGTSEAVLVEMGASKFGSIRTRCEIAKPTIGLVVSVGLAHTEFFGDLNGVAKAKSELIESLPSHGTAILNIDDPFVRDMAQKAKCRTVTFGLDPTADVRGNNQSADSEARMSFDLNIEGKKRRVNLSMHGTYQVTNALAAAAVGHVMGLDFETISNALETGLATPKRMKVFRGPHQEIIMDDTYNANPTSMRAALDSLHAVHADRHIAVLGPMEELGESSEALHGEIAQYGLDRGIQVFGYKTELFGAPGFTSLEDIQSALNTSSERDAILFKASRSQRLEQLVAAWCTTSE